VVFFFFFTLANNQAKLSIFIHYSYSYRLGGLKEGFSLSQAKMQIMKNELLNAVEPGWQEASARMESRV
jgi:hypothetical protein